MKCGVILVVQDIFKALRKVEPTNIVVDVMIHLQVGAQKHESLVVQLQITLDRGAHQGLQHELWVQYSWSWSG